MSSPPTEVKNMEPDRADLVISTVPLRGCRIEHVTVSPFLTDEDYIRVGNKIDALRDSRHLPSRIGEKDLTAKGLLEQLKPAIFRRGSREGAGSVQADQEARAGLLQPVRRGGRGDLRAEPSSSAFA